MPDAAGAAPLRRVSRCSLRPGLGVWTAIRGGLLPDERLLSSAQRLRSDWLLALGALVSLLAWRRLRSLAPGRRGRRQLAGQAAADRADRRLLLSRLDHELKNPLTAMRAAAANVAASAPGADRTRRCAASRRRCCG